MDEPKLSTYYRIYRPRIVNIKRQRQGCELLIAKTQQYFCSIHSKYTHNFLRIRSITNFQTIADGKRTHVHLYAIQGPPSLLI